MAYYRETNLKCRQSIPETAEMADDDNQLGRFNGMTRWENFLSNGDMFTDRQVK